MPVLQALYLGENLISTISSCAFNGLGKLLHLDLSQNHGGIDNENVFLQGQVFEAIGKLKSLDLSFTKINPGDLSAFYSFGRNLERLSLCFTGINRLRPFHFNGTRLRFLDLSGNPGILRGKRLLRGLEGYLQVLYANEIGLKTAEAFRSFNQLEVLALRDNELTTISGSIASTLKNLQILDLTNNRLSIWFWPIFSLMPQLRFLSLRDNNFNIIAHEMLKDIGNINYIAFAGNFVVCNCNCRELFEIAYRNENVNYSRPIESRSYLGVTTSLLYHRGFEDFNHKIMTRKKVSKDCEANQCTYAGDLEAEGNFLLVDFDPLTYQCLLIAEGKSVPFSSIATCKGMKREVITDEMLGQGSNMVIILVIILTIVFPLLILGFIFRRNFIYFCITIRNSATLSLINNSVVPDGELILFFLR